MTSVLGVGAAFVGLVEGVTESTASFLKLFSGWTSDLWQKRKPLFVCSSLWHGCDPGIAGGGDSLGGVR